MSRALHGDACAVDDLFVVSNIGQARSVTSVAASLPTTRSFLVVVLTTRRNVELPAKIRRLLARHDIESELIVLPDLPTHPRFSTVRTIVDIYEQLRESVRAESLWLSNFNAHYSVLASIYADAGTRICYFEEGLGSYRSRDDPLFSTPAMGAARATFRHAVARAFRQRLGWSVAYRWPVACKRFAGSCRRLATDVAAHAATMSAAKPRRREQLAERISPHARRFLEPWTDFDAIRVVFPSLLDPDLFDPSRATAIDLRPPPEEVALANAEMSVAFADDCVEVLFVSQPYGDRSQRFYDAVATALADIVDGRMLVKFHPRETETHRERLRLALLHRQIAAVEAPALAEFTAEAVLATGRVDRCVGLTSSTLLYGRRYEPDVVFVSIARTVLSELSDDVSAAVTWATLATDTDLLESMLVRIMQ